MPSPTTPVAPSHLEPWRAVPFDLLVSGIAILVAAGLKLAGILP